MTWSGAVPTLGWLSDRRGKPTDEADVSAEPAPSREDARVSGAHDHEGWAQGAEASSGEGAQTPVRLTGRFSRRERLTRAADFQALFQQGKRIDRPSLVVLWREGGGSRHVGFAVSRQVRGSVKRNRARRRLREAYRASREAAPANVDLVIVGRPSSLNAGFASLVTEVRGALTAIPGRREAP